jgi:post-segregation antitoxin (ccd killing protein)
MNEKEVLNQNPTWKKGISPRGNCHNKTETKTTVSLYLNKTLVEKARIHKLNISRITEQALSSILDYLETQNIETSSESLNERSLPEKAPGAGSSAWYERRILIAVVNGND